MDAIIANYSGSMVSLTDICMKPLGKDCATQSVLQVREFCLSRYISVHRFRKHTSIQLLYNFELFPMIVFQDGCSEL